MPKIVMLTIAGGLMLLGLISMLTPIPGGTAMIAVSLAILICSSPRFARAVTNARSRFTALNKLMTWVEDRVGQRFGKVLRSTRPTPDLEAGS